jgi:putative flippase GtrA
MQQLFGHVCSPAMKHWFIGKAERSRIQFFRYFFVGGVSTVVDLVVYGSLLYLFGHAWYLVFAFLGYMVGLVCNHLLCLLWVFERKHSRRKEYSMVFLIALGGLFWTELFLWLAVDSFGGDPFFSKMGVVFLVLAWNFGMRKLFVFH